LLLAFAALVALATGFAAAFCDNSFSCWFRCNFSLLPLLLLFSLLSLL
jgi:hypothetical protein